MEKSNLNLPFLITKLKKETNNYLLKESADLALLKLYNLSELIIKKGDNDLIKEFINLKLISTSCTSCSSCSSACDTKNIRPTTP